MFVLRRLGLANKAYDVNPAMKPERTAVESARVLPRGIYEVKKPSVGLSVDPAPLNLWQRFFPKEPGNAVARSPAFLSLSRGVAILSSYERGERIFEPQNETYGGK